MGRTLQELSPSVVLVIMGKVAGPGLRGLSNLEGKTNPLDDHAVESILHVLLGVRGAICRVRGSGVCWALIRREPAPTSTPLGRQPGVLHPILSCPGSSVPQQHNWILGEDGSRALSTGTLQETSWICTLKMHFGGIFCGAVANPNNLPSCHTCLIKQ